MVKQVHRSKIINQMTQYADEFLIENFDTRLKIPIEINSRLKRSLGRFQAYTTDESPLPIKIELSKSLLENEPMEMILDVLKHELVHYALCKKGLPYYDGQSCFEDKLIELGVSATKKLRTDNTKKEVYKCSCKEFNLSRKLDNHARYKGSNYTCPTCNVKLSYVGIKPSNRRIEII